MWFILLIIAASIFLALLIRSAFKWVSGRRIPIHWYEWISGWILGAMGLYLLLFSVQSLVLSVEALEPTAGAVSLFITGMPAILLITLSWLLVAKRIRPQH